MRPVRPGVGRRRAARSRYRPLAGKTPVNLGRPTRGRYLLVVNTASKCGFTPQFEALEGLHARYKARGFAVLASPRAISCPRNTPTKEDPGVLHADLWREIPDVPEGARHRRRDDAFLQGPGRGHRREPEVEFPQVPHRSRRQLWRRRSAAGPSRMRQAIQAIEAALKAKPAAAAGR